MHMRPEPIASVIRRLADLQSQIDEIQAQLKEQRGSLAKRDLKKIARRWGWEIIEGQGKHPTKAVRGSLKVPLTGHGDSDTFPKKTLHYTLKQLALPVLQELEAAQTECIEAVSFYFFEANGYKFIPCKELYQLKEELKTYQRHNQQLQEWVETLKEEVSQLENKKNLSEEAALELLSDLENQNADLQNQVQQLQRQVQFLEEKERIAAQQLQIVRNVQRQLATEKMLQDVLHRLKILQSLLRQCQVALQQLPDRWRRPIQRFLNQMSSILEASLEGSDFHNRLLESEADGTN